ncbi:MAG TPA: FAD-dependent oxidoreductase [Bryobacteraceae bacterium]|jgi:sarcosine oxidase subunit beta|nr:FAD-dependent oxidoreductase [Bryobacteraceae bacterium]
MSRDIAPVVIAGAGIIGSSIAYHLSARGCRDVVVVEKNGAEASGSTARSAAGVRHQFATEVNIRLSIYSIERLKHFEEEVGGFSGLKQIGYLLLVSGPETWAQYRRNVALQQSLGVPSRLLTAKEAADLLPAGRFGDLLGATFCPDDGHCDPHGIATGYLNAARRAGVEVRRSTRVTGFRRSGRRLTAVETTQGTIACETVINAAGPWAGQVGALAGLKIPVLPYRRCVYMTEAVKLPPFPFVIDTETGFYMRPEGEKLLIGATNEAEPPSENLAVDWEWLERVLEMGARRFPFLAETGIVRRNCWAGLYEVTPDDCPILGRHPELDNYIDASGFSGHGVMHAPAAGMLIAEEVLNGRARTINIDDLRITRFAQPREAMETNVY